MRQVTSYCDICGGWVDDEKESAIANTIIKRVESEVEISLDIAALIRGKNGRYDDVADRHTMCLVAALVEAFKREIGEPRGKFSVVCPEDGHPEDVEIYDADEPIGDRWGANADDVKDDYDGETRGGRLRH